MPLSTIDTSSISGLGYGFKNRIINGGMVIFQRGTAASSGYSVDRWQIVKSNDATESVSQNTDAPTGFSYSLRNTVSVGDASIGSTQYSLLSQYIEGYNIADLAWGTASASPITLSFWVKATVTGQYVGNVGNSGDTQMCPFNFTINASNTWEYKTVTIQGPTSGTWLTTNGLGIALRFYSALGSSYTGGTAGVWGTAYGCGSPVNSIASNGNIFAITGVQLEKGTVATSFDYRPYGTELALCQRYAKRYCGNYAYEAIATGYFFSAGQLQAVVIHPVTMRTQPTLTTNISSGGSFQTAAAVGNLNVSSFSLDTNASGTQSSYINASVAGATAGQGGNLISGNNTSSSFLLSAEL